MLPALARAREEARRAVCKSNLAQIGKACVAYTVDHGDRMPASLADLVPQYLADGRVLVCPSDGGDIPHLRNGLPCSYRYVGNLPAREAAPNTMVAYSRGEHEDGRNVLFYDGHVSWMTETAFQAELARQRKELWEPLLKRGAKEINAARVKAFLEDEPYDETQEAKPGK